MRQSDLAPAVKYVLLVLATCRSTRTVRRALDAARRAGWITRSANSDEQARARSQADEYHLTVPGELSTATGHRRPVDTPQHRTPPATSTGHDRSEASDTGVRASLRDQPRDHDQAARLSTAGLAGVVVKVLHVSPAAPSTLTTPRSSSVSCSAAATECATPPPTWPRRSAEAGTRPRSCRRRCRRGSSGRRWRREQRTALPGPRSASAGRRTGVGPRPEFAEVAQALALTDVEVAAGLTSWAGQRWRAGELDDAGHTRIVGLLGDGGAR